ncbi:MAG: tetratricopeptide repeat protein [Chloroflexota bacterium]
MNKVYLRFFVAMLVLTLSTLSWPQPLLFAQAQTCPTQQAEADDLYDQDQFAQAIAKYEAAWACYQQRSDESQAAHIFRRIGNAYGKLEEYQPALDAYLQALPYVQAKGNAESEALLRYFIGEAYRELGDDDASLPYFHHAVDYAQTVNNDVMKLLAGYHIAAAYRRQGETQAALDYFRLSLKAGQARQADKWIPTILEAIAELEFERCQADLTTAVNIKENRFEDALPKYQVALNCYQALENPIDEDQVNVGIAAIYANIASIYVAEKQYESALENYEASVTLMRGLDKPRSLGWYLIGYARSYQKLEQIDKAMQLLEEVIEIAQNIGDGELGVAAYRAAGSYQLEIGDDNEALHFYKAALQLSQEYGLTDKQGELEALISRLDPENATDPASLCERGRDLYWDDKDADARPLLEAAIARWADAPPESLIDLGYCANSLGNILRFDEPEQALQAFKTAAIIYAEVDDDDGLGDAYERIGYIYDEQLKQFEPALEAYTTALAHYRAAGDDLYEEFLLGDIGELYYDFEHYDLAIQTYEELLAINRTRSDIASEIWTLLYLGDAYLEKADFASAQETYALSLKHSRDIVNTEMEVHVLYAMGDLFQAQLEFEIAQSYYELGIQVSQIAGDKIQEKNGLYQIGEGYEAQEDYLTALDYYEQTLTISRAAGSRRAQRHALKLLARVYESLGRTTDAQAATAEVEALTVSLAENPERGSDFDVKAASDAAFAPLMAELDATREWVRLNADGLRAMKHDYEAARIAFEAAVEVSDTLTDLSLKAATLTRLGKIYLVQGRYQDALDTHLTALDIYDQLEIIPHKADNLRALGRAYRALGQTDNALTSLQRSFEVYHDLDDLLNQAHVLVDIGRLHYQAEDHVEALSFYEEAERLYQADNSSAGGSGEIEVSRYIAQVWIALEKYDEAQESFLRLRDIYQRAGFQDDVGDVLNQLGEIYVAQDDLPLAETALQESSNGMAIGYALFTRLWSKHLPHIVSNTL